MNCPFFLWEAIEIEILLLQHQLFAALKITLLTFESIGFWLVPGCLSSHLLIASFIVVGFDIVFKVKGSAVLILQFLSCHSS